MTRQTEGPTDAELKAAHIAKNGVKKCPRPEDIYGLKAVVKKGDEAKSESRPKSEPKPAAPPRDLGSKPVLMWVPTSELHLDMDYQRNISTRRGQRLIREIFDKFQWPLFQPITITQREESGYWVIDGQHRMAAAAHLGIREIPAVLLDNLTQAQQAMAFAGINGRRVAVNVYAIHHAMVAAADEASMRLADICAKADVAIPRYPKRTVDLRPDETLSIKSIQKVMKAHGDDAAIWALRVVRRAYPEEPGMISPASIMLLAAFYAAYAELPVNDEAIRKALREVDPTTLKDEAALMEPKLRIPWMTARLAWAYNAALPPGKTKLPVSEQAIN